MLNDGGDEGSYRQHHFAAREKWIVFNNPRRAGAEKGMLGEEGVHARTSKCPPMVLGLGRATPLGPLGFDFAQHIPTTHLSVEQSTENASLPESATPRFGKSSDGGACSSDDGGAGRERETGRSVNRVLLLLA